MVGSTADAVAARLAVDRCSVSLGKPIVLLFIPPITDSNHGEHMSERALQNGGLGHNHSTPPGCG